MSGFIPELTTRVTVTIDTGELDNALSVINGDEILSEITPLADEIMDAKSTLESLKEPLGKAVSEGLQSNQEMIISAKHYKSGLMANSVDIMEDGDDFLVGNTAMSVDGFPYPLAIDKGSKDHWVAPVTFSALHWSKDGTDYFSKGHMVSGIQEDPFVEPSINQTLWDIDEIVNPIVDEVFR